MHNEMFAFTAHRGNAKEYPSRNTCRLLKGGGHAPTKRVFWSVLPVFSKLILRWRVESPPWRHNTQISNKKCSLGMLTSKWPTNVDTLPYTKRGNKFQLRKGVFDRYIS